MKNILNYETVRDFMSGDGNVPPITWYCQETVSENGNFSYTASGTQEQGSTEKHYKGQVKEIVPGVAYIKESGLTVYNSGFPLMEFNDSSKYHITYPWSEFGITQELFDKYLDAAKNRLFPGAFNVFISNSLVYSISYYNGNLNLWCGEYILVIKNDGTVYIRSSAA